MSSIISDIFYGSKQNILDNYLVNRHGQQQSSVSKEKEQQSGLFTSYLQLIIALPSSQGLDKQAVLHVKA